MTPSQSEQEFELTLKAPAKAGQHSWTLAVAGGLLLLFAALYSRTFASLASMWWGSDDYTHGFLVPVIALYIAWRKGCSLLSARAEPAMVSGIFLTALAAAVLMAGKLGSVVVLEELSIPLMIAGLVVLLAGPVYLRILWFPIAYLLFMVKMFGEGSEKFHWPFQILASNIGVWLLHAAGIPAYKEVQYIQLPNIMLEVASACSGLRFLVSIIAIGLPLAWLTQNSWVKRIGLVLFAITIAVLANGLRVALIGVWAFYGGEVVHGPMHVFQGMFVAWIGFIALFVGAWFLSGKVDSSERSKPTPPLVLARGVLDRVSSATRWKTAAGAAAFILAATWGLYNFYRTSPAPLAAPVSLPDSLGSWTATGEQAADFLNAAGGTEEFAAIYKKGDSALRVYVSYYDEQAQDREMVNYRNSWKLHRGERQASIVTDGGSQTVNAALLKENVDRRVALFWYQMDGHVISDRIEVKLWTVWKALSSRRTNGAIVIVSARAGDAAANERIEAEAAELAGLLIPAVTRLMNENEQDGRAGW